MSSKYRRKNRKHRFLSVLFFLFLFLLLFYFTIFTMQHAFTSAGIASEKLLYYHGSYKLCKLRYNRNTNYLFELGNGDSIIVKPELLQCFDSTSLPSELSFAYTRNRNIIPSAHTAVEIKHLDTVFLSKESTLSEARLGILVGTVFVTLCLTQFMLYIFLSRPTKRKR